MAEQGTQIGNISEAANSDGVDPPDSLYGKVEVLKHH